MTTTLVYWILMLLWLVLGVYTHRRATAQPQPAGALAGDLLIFLLFLIIGWAEFGAPVR